MTDDLDERVQTLLKEVDAECERLGRRAEEAATSENGAEPEDPSSDAGDRETEPAEGESQPGAAADDGPSLDDQVSALVEDAETRAADGAAPSADGPNAELDKLDEDLARITDDLLDGDFEAPDGSADTEHAPAPRTTAPEPAAARKEPASEPEPSVPAHAEGEDTIEKRDESPLVRADEATGRVAVAVDILSRFWTLVLLVWRRGVVPVAMATATAMSRPLSNRPPVIRDTVGWIAVYTLFLAVCVWSFVLIFRQPEPPEAASTPARMIVDDSSARVTGDTRQ